MRANNGVIFFVRFVSIVAIVIKVMIVSIYEFDKETFIFDRFVTNV